MPSRWSVLLTVLVAASGCAIPEEQHESDVASVCPPYETFLPDGWTYEGESLNDVPHGFGRKTWPDGKLYEVYEGNFWCGWFHGEGVLTFRDAEYVGQFKEDRRYGRGVMTYPGGYPKSGIWIEGRFSVPTDPIRLPPRPTFGLLESDPVPVGGSFDRGLDNMRSYLLRLIGPNGEESRFTRLGTCCHFDSDSSPFGRGLLERYSVTYEGLEEPIVVYINWYERDELGPVPGLQLK